MRNLVIADQQILQGVAATLEWFNVDGNGNAVAASGTVTIGVDGADGTEILAAATATTADSARTGRYTRALTAPQTADLDVLTATWTDDGDSSAHTTTVEIIGRPLVTFEEARSSHASLASVSDELLLEKLLAATGELEWICNRAFSPRYRYDTLDGTGEQRLTPGHPDIRTIEAVSVDGTAYTSGELADLYIKGLHDEHLDQTDGSVWPEGQNNTVLGYTFGLPGLPPDVREAFLARFRILVHGPKSGIPDRTTQMSVDGATYQLDRANQYKTGFDAIDAVYGRWSTRSSDDKPRPYSQQLDFNPQYLSLYHGGRL